MITDTKRLIVVLGPTACGKTHMATLLASRINGQIISADSRQIYRRMDIGTGKDLTEYNVGGKAIPYHMIDIAEAGYHYNLYEYCRDFDIAMSKIAEAGDTPILCGGTGLYIEAVLDGYKMVEVPRDASLRRSLDGKCLEELRQILARYKTLHNTTDTSTVARAVRAIEIADYYEREGIGRRRNERPTREYTIFGIDIDRDTRRRRISERLQARIDGGMIDEVGRLLADGLQPDDLIYYGLEYKYITQYVVGDISFDEMYRSLETAIHRFSKRQMTWFRGMERRGFDICWLPYDIDDEEKLSLIVARIS